MDLGNEYRTYGLLRVFTVIWAAIFGYNPYAYGFLLGSIHCASSVLVFFVARRALCGRLGDKRSILISAVWLMNPFSTTQSMHHMLYILMPAYFFLLFLFVDLYMKKYKAIMELLCMLGVVFFGENMIVTLYLFLIYRIWQCRKRIKEAAGYLINACITVTLLLSHYLHYKCFRYEPGSIERFSISGLSDLTIANLWEGIKKALTDDIGNIFVVWNKFNLGYVREQASVWKICFYLFLCLLLYGVVTRKCCDGEELPRKSVFAVVFLCISTYFIYLILQILGSGGFNSRYMMACVPSILIGCILLLALKTGRKWRYLEVALFCCVAVSWCIHYDIMMKYMNNYNSQVIEAIQKGEENKKYVVFANSYPNNTLAKAECERLRQPGIFTDSEQFCSVINGSTVASPFQMFWSIYGWMNAYSDMTPAYYYDINGDGTVNLQGMNKYKNVPKEDIMVICTEDIYFYNNDRKIDLHEYYDFDEFTKNSLAYNGIEILGDKSYQKRTGRIDSLDKYYDLIYNSNILSVNLGSDYKNGILLPDKEYAESNKKEISYGYLSGGISLYEGNGVTGFESNRNGEFEYRVELPDIDNRILCVEFSDVWSMNTGKRIFDLVIQTDHQQIVIPDIDLYSIGKNDIVRMLIPLEQTGSIDIRAKAKDGDIPFCNIIRVLKGEER